MNTLILLAAAIGVASTTPVGFLHHPPADIRLATQNFVQEYNRLAKLAADAPDIEVYNDDGTPLKLGASPNAIQNNPNIIPITQIPKGPVINPLNGLTMFTFAANLGSNSQFQPNQFQSFPFTDNRAVIRSPQAPVRNTVHSIQTQRTVVPVQNNRIQPSSVQKWQGPLAHTVPAGINGPPIQVADTPAVAAARNAHFAILSAAFQRAAEEARRNPPQQH